MKKYITTIIILLFTQVTFADDWNSRHIEDIFISDEFSEICVFDSIAYLATLYGLVKMDIADRVIPVILERYPMNFEICELAKRDSLLFVGYRYRDNMDIFSLSNPTIPELITTYNTDGPFSGAYFLDSLLFLNASGYLYLYMIDDIRNPAFLDSIRGPAFSIDFYEQFAYRAYNHWIGVFNFEDPNNLGESHFVSLHDYDIDNAYDILIEDDLAYVGSSPLSIFSLRNNPLEPELIGLGESNGRHIAKTGDNVFLGSRDIYVYDVSSPRAPEEVASIEIEGESILDWTLEDSILYSVHGENGLRIFDVANPQRPELLTHYENSGEYSKIVPYQHYLYQKVRKSNNEEVLKIISVEEPLHPVVVDSMSWPLLDVISNIVIGRDLLAVQLRYEYFDSLLNRERLFSGTEFYSLENPVQPAKLSTVVDLLGGKQIMDGYFYVGGDDDIGLSIYSLENIEEPRLVGTYNEHGRCDRIVLQDDLLITHNQRGNVYTIVIWDKSDPENLEQLGIAYNWVRSDFVVLGN
jgi:hypothetical protein